jgi:crossover junction endodeoxyribonuclease RuvC
MRILGIDPSLRGTGYGVIEVQGSKYSPITYGVIQNPSNRSASACLTEIFDQITQVIAQTNPTVAAVEGVIYLQNYQTAITLGAARGAGLLAVAKANLQIYEYAPKRIKAAATGKGAAGKNQVIFMMRALLGLKENPPSDAADALAVAITHAQNSKLLMKAKVI